MVPWEEDVQAAVEEVEASVSEAAAHTATLQVLKWRLRCAFTWTNYGRSCHTSPRIAR